MEAQPEEFWRQNNAEDPRRRGPSSADCANELREEGGERRRQRSDGGVGGLLAPELV